MDDCGWMRTPEILRCPNRPDKDEDSVPDIDPYQNPSLPTLSRYLNDTDPIELASSSWWTPGSKQTPCLPSMYSFFISASGTNNEKHTEKRYEYTVHLKQENKHHI
ncbi:hypothetical protein AFLA_010336 [Aspergillus flavus NRRL3357]|nr:hypothetical protein AFLA_010336 [Aspergillus flavus NRRL3357]